MLSSIQCFKKFGIPGLASREGKYMTILTIPLAILAAMPVLPAKIYCHQLIATPLLRAFENVIRRGYAKELKEWNGCYIVRKKRGALSLSLHSWGLAIDVNASTNGFGKRPTLSAGFVQCFVDAGFDWGGKWNKPDGMHFQLAQL